MQERRAVLKQHFTMPGRVAGTNVAALVNRIGTVSEPPANFAAEQLALGVLRRLQ